MSVRKVNAAVIVAVCFLGCADDVATRDYTAEACPSPLHPGAEPEFGDSSVCDRGRGQSPRFVPLRACMEELRLRPGTTGWGLNSTSPVYLTCRPAVLVYTLDDVRNGPGLVAY